ncbi:MAG: hypothetical protein R2861_01400 [Desulfobacterales bacterium]
MAHERKPRKNPDKGSNDAGRAFFRGNTGKGVVITHPHPLYGGDMRNLVVETLVRAFQKKDMPPCGLISGGGPKHRRL